MKEINDERYGHGYLFTKEEVEAMNEFITEAKELIKERRKQT